MTNLVLKLIYFGQILRSQDDYMRVIHPNPKMGTEFLSSLTEELPMEDCNKTRNILYLTLDIYFYLLLNQILKQLLHLLVTFR